MTKKSAGDHSLAAIKAGISLVPIFGGSIASLINDYIPTSTQRLLDEFMADLGTRLKTLEDRIDVESVDKEDFAELFKSSFLLVVRSHRAEKRNAAANLLVNLLLKRDDPSKLSYTELDHFARSLDLLSIGAYAVLAKIIALRREQLGMEHGRNITLTFRGLKSRLPALDPSLLMGIARELDALNLIQFPASFATITPDYEEFPIGVTGLGIRFLDHVLQGEDPDGGG